MCMIQTDDQKTLAITIANLERRANDLDFYISQQIVDVESSEAKLTDANYTLDELQAERMSIHAALAALKNFGQPEGDAA